MGFLNSYAHNSGGGNDPFFSSVVMLAHFDGTNGSNVYINSCSRGAGITTTTPGKLSTSGMLFGSACLALTGGGIFPSSTSSDYTMGSGDFTMEVACYTGSPSQTAMLLDLRTIGVSVCPALYITGGTFRYYVNGVDVITGGSVATSTWQRLSVSKVSGTTRLFLDGTQSGSNYTDSNTYAGTTLAFGGDSFNSLNSLTGNLDEGRLTKGVGRYSSNYTVDAAAFPNF